MIPSRMKQPRSCVRERRSIVRIRGRAKGSGVASLPPGGIFPASLQAHIPRGFTSHGEILTEREGRFKGHTPCCKGT